MDALAEMGALARKHDLEAILLWDQACQGPHRARRTRLIFMFYLWLLFFAVVVLRW